MKKHGDSEGKKVILYLVIVFVFLGAVYFLTTVLVSKNKYLENTTVDNGSVSIQYSEILLGEVFSKSQEEYLVLCYDKEEESSEYASVVSGLTTANKVKLYTVDLSHAMNKSLLGEESNTHPTKASEIKIHGATLFHFKNGELVDYIEGKEAINTFVKEYE